MASTANVLQDFPLYSTWVVSGGRITEGPEVSTETKTFQISGIPENSTIISAVFSASFGNPLSGAALLTVNNISVGLGIQSVPLTPTASGNGSYVVNFAFRAQGDADMSDGTHGGTCMVGEPTVTVEYTPPDEGGGGGEGGGDDEEEIEEGVSGKYICLFPPRTTSFEYNGRAVLSPFSCVIHEEAGGDYSLQMEHPMDVLGKWALIQEEWLIRSPVPEKYTPRAVIPPAALWRVTASTAPLYSVLPSYTKAKTDVDYVIDNPSIWAWTANKVYASGDLAVWENGIYRALRTVSGGPSPSSNSAWLFVVNTDGSGGSTSPSYIYNEGTVAETLQNNEIITFVADYNQSYIRVRSLRGVSGYVRRIDVAQTQDSSGAVVIAPRHITTQVFRVQSVSVNADIRTVSVYATHISYDYGANKLYDCQLTECDPASAIAIMQGSTINPDERTIVCTVSGPAITKDWSWSSPISALLDPDSGLIPTLRAQLIRDNEDFFIVPNSTPSEGPALRYGLNLLGIHWERALDEIVTRVLPRGEDKDGNNLLLPELFVDSPNIANFALTYTEVLNVGCKIGSEITHADGTKETLTEEDCYALMRTAGQNRFAVDHADEVALQLSVNVLLLGDTAEYAQYRGLENLHLYDRVPITGPEGFSASAQISEYSWDAVSFRYQSITLGKIFSFGGRTVAGYNVADGAISYNKLSPGAIKKIQSA